MPERTPHPPTLASLLTALGRSAVATVGISGANSVSVVNRWLRPAARDKHFTDFPTGRIVFGRWSGDDGEEIVACRVADDCVELHCHGGQVAAARILDDLAREQCQVVDWSHWVLARTGKVLDQELAAALAEASTQRSASILLDQREALPRETCEIIERINLGDLDGARQKLRSMLAWSSLGLHLTKPWRVVIAGRPNVGKSSLINALVGYERAIVFDQPGTTRDVVTAATALEGWPVELADTAGLRASDCKLEAAGIERTLHETTAADCLVLVFDASEKWSDEDQRLLERYPTALIVHNKSDLQDAFLSARPSGLQTSALSGAGLPTLMKTISQSIVPLSPPPGTAAPFTHRQQELLDSALTAAQTGQAAKAAELLDKLIVFVAAAQR
jgi:tRNA modification GTPase